MPSLKIIKKEWLTLKKNQLVNKTPEKLDSFVKELFAREDYGLAVVAPNYFKTEGNGKAKCEPLQFDRIMRSNGFMNQSSEPDVWYRTPTEQPINFDYTNGHDSIKEWSRTLLYLTYLGSPPYIIEDFINLLPLKVRKTIDTVIEPMAAEASLCFFGHFKFHNLRYVMLDIDEQAREQALAWPWLPDVSKEYLIQDVLLPKKWTRSPETSLCFIGKQSYNVLSSEQNLALYKNIRNNSKAFVLETEYMPSRMVGVSADLCNVGFPSINEAGYPSQYVLTSDCVLEDKHHLRFFLKDEKSGVEKDFYSAPWRQCPFYETVSLLQKAGYGMDEIYITLEDGNGKDKLFPITSKKAAAYVRESFKDDRQFVLLVCIRK